MLFNITKQTEEGMLMHTSHSCPRCKNALIIDCDEYGWYEECIMCGYLYDLEDPDIAGQSNNDIDSCKSPVETSD